MLSVELFYLIPLLLGAGFCAYKMAAIDWRRRIIPDVYLFPFILIGMVIVAYFPWVSSPGESAIAAALGYAMGTIIGLVFELATKRKQTGHGALGTGRGNPAPTHSPIGMGDIKLLAAGGIWLGATGLAIAIVISCAIGGIWGLITKQKYIPFAPFFLFGLIIALLIMFFLI